MGAVWEAEDERLGRRVAVKLMITRLARDEKALRRFEREARAVARLNSPFVVQLLDFGVEKAPYMVMELLEGEELKERLSREGKLPLRMVATVVAQAAKALSTAHAAGVVHRDLKPANIFIVRDQEDEYIKVFDFGTAKALTGFKDAKTITTLGAILGTPLYMSPEQLAGDDDTDHRADVWSLAVVAYHALTGVAPFPGEEMGEIIHGIVFKKHAPPSSLDASLPEDLDIFFDQALAKDRERRFQSARSLAGALCSIADVSMSMSVRQRFSSEGAPDTPPPSSEDPFEALLRAAEEESSADSKPSRARSELSIDQADDAGAKAFALDHIPMPEDADHAAASAWAAQSGQALEQVKSASAVAAAEREEQTPQAWAENLKSVPRSALGVGAAAALVIGGGLAWMLFGGGTSASTAPPIPASSAPIATQSAVAPTPSASAVAAASSSTSSAVVAPSASVTAAPSASDSASAKPKGGWRPSSVQMADDDYL
jgi:serine/threonine protein kinase